MWFVVANVGPLVRITIKEFASSGVCGGSSGLCYVVRQSRTVTPLYQLQGAWYHGEKFSRRQTCIAAASLLSDAREDAERLAEGPYGQQVHDQLEPWGSRQQREVWVGEERELLTELRDLAVDGLASCKVQAARAAAAATGEGRGLYATRVVAKGEPLLSIPQEKIISPLSLPPHIASRIPPECSHHARLALFLLLRPDHPHLSRLFSTYLRTLPPLHSLHSTVLWSEAERSLLPAGMAWDAAERLSLMCTEYALVAQTLADCRGEFVGGCGMQRFLGAYALVSSRAWFLESTNSLCLVPLADMVNHDAHSMSLLRFDDDQQCAQIVAPVALSPGDQVMVSYGGYSNATLALDFGFAVPDNPHDQVETCVLLGAMEAHASGLAGMGSASHAGSWMEEKRTFLRHTEILPGSGQEAGAPFTLSRVGSPAGQANKGVPHRLRVLARVMAASSPEEMEVLAAELARRGAAMGQRPMRLGPGRGRGRDEWEGRAMLLLLSAVEDLHDAAVLGLQVVEDEASSPKASLHPVRADMARTIHSSLVSLLRSVAAWLRPRALGGGLDTLLHAGNPTGWRR